LSAVLQSREELPTPVGYHETREKLIPLLMESGVVLTAESDHPRIVVRGTERGFMLKLHETHPDAPLSPILFLLKESTITPKIIELSTACMAYIHLSRKIDCYSTAGVPQAGDPFALKLAGFMGTPCIQLIKEEQDGKRHIASVKDRDTVPSQVQTVSLIDTVMSSGRSLAEAVMVLRSAQLHVSHAFVLIDREQGGVERMAKLGITAHTVFTANELLDAYVKSGDLSRYMRTKIAQYLLKNSS
jgi:orotate phosphoribosyltransferase